MPRCRAEEPQTGSSRDASRRLHLEVAGRREFWEMAGAGCSCWAVGSPGGGEGGGVNVVFGDAS